MSNSGNSELVITAVKRANTLYEEYREEATPIQDHADWTE